MANQVEIEAKYRIPAKVKSKVFALFSEPSIYPEECEILDTRRKMIQDNYFDTGSLDLYKHGACLRLRHEDDKPLKISFKLSSQDFVPDAFTRRLEIEGAPSAGLLQKILDQCNWPDYQLRKPESFKFSGDTFTIFTSLGMYEIFRLQNLRESTTVRYNDRTIIELSLDDVICAAPKKTADFAELEAELIEGSETDLHAFLEHFLDHLPKLKPAKGENKYRRSLKLLGFLKKKKQKPVNTVENWQHQLGKIYRKFHKMYQRALEFKDIEDLHQARVSLRKLLTMMDFLKYHAGDDAPLQHMEVFYRRVKKIQKHLGKIRDLDVFIEKIHVQEAQPDEAVTGRVFHTELLPILEKERDLARYHSTRKLRKHYKKSTFRHWKRFFRDDLQKLVRQSRIHDKLDVLKREFFQLFEEFEKSKNALGVHHPETVKLLHRIRIVAKKLRYALQYMAFALPYDPAPVIQIYTKIQDELGDFNDLNNFKILHLKMIDAYGGLLSRRFKNRIRIIDAAMEEQMVKAIDAIEKIMHAHQVPDESAVEKQDGHGQSQAEHQNLKQIKGLGPKSEEILNAHGITSFEQLAALTPNDLEAMDAGGSDLKERALRGHWFEQAAKLLTAHSSPA